MTECKYCGNKFDSNALHMIYAFVGGGIVEPETVHLCPKHTDRLGELMRSEGMALSDSNRRGLQ